MTLDPAIVIRSFRDADAPGVRECMVEEQDALRELDPRMPEGSAMVDAYVVETLDACEQNDGMMFVADVGNHVVGFVTLLKCVPHSGADDGPGSYAAIMDLAVRHEWQGRGLGAALLQWAEAEAIASGVTELRLNVLSKNRRAISLYERLGFLPYSVTLSKRFDR